MDTESESRIVIAAGGTGGHIFPALAVAEECRQRGLSVHWLGCDQGLEQRLVAPHYPLHTVRVAGLRGKSWSARARGCVRLGQAFWQTYRCLQQLKPRCVLGMGGFVSGPAGLAARLLRIPLLIHEQNAVAGLTNRILSKLTPHIYSAFPDVFAPSVSTQVIGNPLRAAILALPPPSIRYCHADPNAPLRVLVLGGSQGAQAINTVMQHVLECAPSTTPLTVWHQTGERDYESVRQYYRLVEIKAHVDAFIDDMPKAYAWADVVIARAGALTVSEIAAVGVASILIPFPHAVDDHQTHNAAYLAKANAAIMRSQASLNPTDLMTLLTEFARDRQACYAVAERARGCAQSEATQLLATACESLGRRLG